jgi:flagellar biosynthesis protein FlhF
VIAEVVRGGARGAFAIDAAARSIGSMPAILSSPKRPRGNALPPVIAFVGPTGVGKTSSLVKLGRRLREAGRKVVFASLDPLALGALERATGIESDVDRGEVPLAIVRDLGDLRRALRRGGGADAVLLDTPGLSPRDDASIDELARELSRLRPLFELQTLLVLPATDARGTLRLASRAFARTRPDGAVLTKLDESDEPAAALEELSRARLPLAFLADGQDTRAHLVRPTPERFADLVLRGRLG